MLAERLIEWFEDHGGRLQAAVEIAHDEANGYHLQAKAVIDVSVPVVYCPLGTTLSIDNVVHEGSTWPQAFISKFRFSSPEVLVRFLLMNEYLKGITSKWWPYIVCLPGPEPEPGKPSLDTPLWFNEHDRAWLKGTNIDAAIDERQRLWQKELSEGISLLKGVVGCTSYTWPLYKWAATILSSRCFPRRGPGRSDPIRPNPFSPPIGRRSPPVLCPVLDLANHNPSAHVVWIIGDDGYTLLTEDVITPGAQIFNNYGHKGNEELLMGYGFTLPENMADAFAMSICLPTSPSIKWVQDVVSKGGSFPLNVLGPPLEITKIDDGQFIGTCYLDISGRTSEPLLGLLSLIVANERELKQLQGFPHEATVPGQHRLSRRMQLQATMQLRKALVTRYEKIVETGKDLPNKPANSRQLHSLRYRNGQRDVLQAHISRLSKELSEAALGMHAITFDCIMTSSPSLIRREIRTALRNVVGTRDVVRLRQRGYQDVVFALFIGIVWMTFANVPQDADFDSDSSTTDPPSSNTSSAESLHSALHSWCRFVSSAYCSPPDSSRGGSDLVCRSVNCHCSPDQCLAEEKQKPWTLSMSQDEKLQDEEHTSTGYLIIQRASLLGEPNTIFRDKRWTKEFLKWALGIWRAEAVTMPTTALTSKENEDDKDEADGHAEERLLLLEIKDETIGDEQDTDSTFPSAKRQKLIDKT